MEDIEGMKRYLTLVILSVFALFSSVQAVEGAGTTTCDFLRMEQGARAVGMGGTFVAVADDVYATYWNPAGLAQLKKREFGASYARWFEDIDNAFLAYAHPINAENGTTVGGSLTWLGVDEIELYDSSGNYEGMTVVSNYALSLAYARRFMEIASVGLNIKGISQNLAGLKGSGMAADLGLLAGGEKFSFGLNVANIGPEFYTDGKKNKLPLNIRTGLAYRFKALGKPSFLALGLDAPTDSDVIFHIGGESWLTRFFAMRIGYDSFEGVSAGLGFQAEGKGSLKAAVGQLDYAATFPRNTNFDTIHRFSYTVNF